MEVHGCASAHCSVGDAVAVAFAAAIDDDINKNWLNAKKEGEKWEVVDDALANKMIMTTVGFAGRD